MHLQKRGCFSRLMSCPGLTKLVIWTLGVALLTAMTTYHFLAIFFEYTNNNGAIQVEVVVIDENFKPPQMVLQIPMYKLENIHTDPLMLIVRHYLNGTLESCDVCKELTLLSWDVWNQENLADPCSYGFEACYYTFSFAITKKIFTVMDAEGLNFFDQSSIFWHEVIFSAAANSVMSFSVLDYRYADPKFPRSIGPFHTWTVPENHSKVDILNLQVLYGLCDDIAFEEYDLQNEFFEQISFNKTCRDLISDPTTILTLDDDGLWIALPGLAIPKMKEYRFTISHTNRAIYWSPPPDAKSKQFSVYPDVGVMYVATIDSIHSAYIYQSMFKPDKEGRLIIIRYSVQMRARETRPDAVCYNGSSATVCLTKCTKHYIIKECGCVPFSTKEGLADYNSNLPYCSWSNYANCNIAEVEPKNKKACMDKCKAACEYTSYSWQIDDDSYKPTRRNITELRLRMIPAFGTFNQLLWTNKNTLEQFLSQVSGIVNFYLGFSGITLIGLILMGLDFLKMLYRKLRRMQKAMDRQHGGYPLQMAGKPVDQDGARVSDDKWQEKIKNELRMEIQALRNEINAELRTLKDAFLKSDDSHWCRI